jgi:hypothetical protein
MGWRRRARRERECFEGEVDVFQDFADDVRLCACFDDVDQCESASTFAEKRVDFEHWLNQVRPGLPASLDPILLRFDGGWCWRVTGMRRRFLLGFLAWMRVRIGSEVVVMWRATLPL